MLILGPAQTRRSSILFLFLFFTVSANLNTLPIPHYFICQSVSSHVVLFWRLPVPRASKFLPKWIHAHFHLSLVWTSVDIPQAVSCLPNPIYIFFYYLYYCVIWVTSMTTQLVNCWCQHPLSWFRLFVDLLLLVMYFHAFCNTKCINSVDFGERNILSVFFKNIFYLILCINEHKSHLLLLPCGCVVELGTVSIRREESAAYVMRLP